MIPLSDSIKSSSFPYVTIALIVINAYVFFLELTAPHAQQFIDTHAFVPAQFGIGSIDAWKHLFFAMFMHGGWVHIGSNMLFLWVFGDNVEDTLGHIQYLLFYLFCGIAASLMQFFIDPSSTIPMIGASGAIAGVLGAYWHLYPHSSIKSLVPIGFFITLLNIPASIMIGLWFVTQLLSGYASIATSSSSGDVGGIAFWAHVGGFIAGLLLIRIFPKRKRTFWRVD